MWPRRDNVRDTTWRSYLRPDWVSEYDIHINRNTVYLLLIWLAINAGDAVWIYFYGLASIQPNPPTMVNRNHRGFQAYRALMFLFGAFWAFVNVLLAYEYFSWTFRWGRKRHRPSPPRSVRRRMFKWSFNLFIAVPFAALFILMPTFGGLVVGLLAQVQAWNHGCDSYPMFAILAGRGPRDSVDAPNVIHFYSGSSSHSNTLFTYDVENNTDTNVWTFQLRQFDDTQDLIPIDEYPTLQYLQYDLNDNTLTGNCTTSSTIGNGTSCLTGTFNLNQWLSFNLTSAIPLNNTTSPVQPTTSLLQVENAQWFFPHDAPSLVLRLVDSLTNKLGREILHTATAKVSDCRQLKVCLAGSGSPGGLVGAEVLASLGLIMTQEVVYARNCSSRNPNQSPAIDS